MPDIHEIRKEFPIFENMKSGEVLPFAYLDNAATSQRPKCVIDAEMELYEKHNANPLRGSYPLSVEATDIYENARKSVRKFINADTSSEIVFTRNTSESINLVAYSYGLSYVGEGDEVLVSIMEHHSNLLPWQMVTRKTGAKLKFIECENDGSIDLEKIKALINEKTKIVAITYENPVKEIAKLAHEKGAVIVVDGAQSTPHIKIDVKEMDVDFFAFSGHKMFGPMGIGVLYGKEEILDKMPPFLTGGEMIDSVSRYDAVYAELPHKFEAGTVNAAGAAGLDAAIKFMNKIGYEYMQERELMLTKRALDGMIKIPHITVYGSDKAKNHTGILTFKIDDVHPHDVREILIADGIAVRAGHHCAQPLLQYLGVNSTTRASFMFYNTEEEIDRFLESIATVRERMGYGK